jgi:hypothetical protein
MATHGLSCTKWRRPVELWGARVGFWIAACMTLMALAGHLMLRAQS